MLTEVSGNGDSGCSLKVNTLAFAYELNNIFGRKRRIKEDSTFFGLTEEIVKFIEENWKIKALDGGNKSVWGQIKCEMSFRYEVEMREGNCTYGYTVQDKHPEQRDKFRIHKPVNSIFLNRF